MTTQEGVNAVSGEADVAAGVSRRMILRVGAVGAAGAALFSARAAFQPYLAQRGLLSPDGAFAATSTALSDVLYLEAFPTSPLILSPFSDVLPIPKALAPIPKSVYGGWAKPPGPGNGQQNSMGNERHQIWPGQLGYPDPLVYKIDVLLRTHGFTTSQVLPINSLGQPTISFDASGNTFAPGRSAVCR